MPVNAKLASLVEASNGGAGFGATEMTAYSLSPQDYRHDQQYDEVTVQFQSPWEHWAAARWSSVISI